MGGLLLAFAGCDKGGGDSKKTASKIKERQKRKKESGTWLGFNAGMRGQKGSEYDGGHRVPFFVHWPKGNLKGGRDVETITAHVDVVPTLIDLCDIPVPVG